jgi:hypothetical protein
VSPYKGVDPLKGSCVIRQRQRHTDEVDGAGIYDRRSIGLDGTLGAHELVLDLSIHEPVGRNDYLAFS